MEKQRIAIFASGGGSNALKLLNHFEEIEDIQIELLLTNNENAGILNKLNERVPHMVINNEAAKDGLFLTQTLQSLGIDYIVLAGYLRKIPIDLIRAYPTQIINIHPALLPKYGGKGMYGMHVHEAVYKNKETSSGITIHLVDEIYDNGQTLAQITTPIEQGDTPSEIQQKVLKIEHQYYAKVVEEYIRSQHDS
ncbi:phosphoribosylglycinamide formyltransferase [Brumimicrobium salinarum]|uniref:phosphoribosylglycinamide formyltransferase 1 n=1 Tax=Brumimicrobium salinarum TaxID=2058658 RepID=A0A2I0R659_9FLAO|nr:phosphoribosylglycinamide formyltransferase [Brumimicrobium salinarum]PKR82066.1 phosphoribosylglycinamide formyltransferase [Brumimicrobium salinarum]